MKNNYLRSAVIFFVCFVYDLLSDVNLYFRSSLKWGKIQYYLYLVTGAMEILYLCLTSVSITIWIFQGLQLAWVS